ncbi:MAG: hypothetical protein QXS51_04665 [Thermoproteota archaeon]|nr:hypothetical protein [Candidatus Brockarchaeota archaeon]
MNQQRLIKAMLYLIGGDGAKHSQSISILEKFLFINSTIHLNIDFK